MSPDRAPAAGDLPLPAAGERWALFLDFDGTLVEIAPTPDAVRVEPGLPPLLESLCRGLDGALAVVSGRAVEDIDRRLAPARLPVVGIHGLELRLEPGAQRAEEAGAAELDGPRRRLEALVREDPRLLLEDKSRALALHYRAAPERGDECRRRVREILQALPGYHLLEGKMVLELRPVDAGKGRAVTALLRRHPFRDRRPVFVGDDVTDEEGFEVVEEAGGLAIKVGEGASRARVRCPSVAALRAWLEDLAGRLAPAAGRPAGGGRAGRNQPPKGNGEEQR